MYCLSASLPGYSNNFLAIQIGVRCGTFAQGVGFIGEANVLEIAVSLGVNRDGLDAEFPAGAQDAQGDFAPVGNQDFTDHGVILDGGSLGRLGAFVIQ